MGYTVNAEDTRLPDVDTISLAHVESKALSWLWEQYIPSGALTFCFGDGGVGKSFLSLAIAAAVTRGWPLPGEEQKPKPPGNVIVQNAENALPTVVKPRLELLGADCERVHCINESERRLTLSDERIEAAIKKHNARLMILDPLWNRFHKGSYRKQLIIEKAATANA